MVDIFVGNFAAEVAEQELRLQFGPYGEVRDVCVVLDRRTGRSRGFAFVKMPKENEAQAAALALNRKDLSGRRMRVIVTGLGASPSSLGNQDSATSTDP